MRGMIALMLLAAAAPALAAKKFDLACTGQRRWAPDGATEPVAARYHVDTQAGKWCRDDCFETRALTANGPRLVFKAQPRAVRQDESFDESVDPAGTDWIDTYQGPYPPGDYWAIAGSCRVEAFTGLKK